MDRATIINHMLSVIGESGVSSTTSTHPSVQAASRILDTEDTDFQQVGWWFNTEQRLKLLPNNLGEVLVPSAALDMRMSDVGNMTPAEKLRYTRRGGLLYDTFKHTTNIATTVYVDLIVMLPISSLPGVAASYLMHRAAEAMFLDDDGDTFKAGKLERRTTQAFANLKSVELRTLSANALDTPFARTLLNGVGSARGKFNRLDGGSQ